MGISTEALFYGAALWLLATEFGTAKIKNHASHPHLFRVEARGTKAFVLFKYRNSARPWAFPIGDDEGGALARVASRHGGAGVYLALVCRQDGVCCASLAELARLAGRAQGDLAGVVVSVDRRPRSSFRVRIGREQLDRTIAAGAWPSRLLGEAE